MNKMLKILGLYGVKAGRKSRQKARKLAFQFYGKTIRVIPKKGECVYLARYYKGNLMVRNGLENNDMVYNGIRK